MKKNIFITAISCLLILFYLYNSVYNINNSSPDIEKNIEDFITKGTDNKGNTGSIRIIDSIIIDNKLFITFHYNNTSLGLAELNKGITNKYKIHSTIQTSDVFVPLLCKTNKSEYLILIGRNNYIKKISNIELTYNSKNYIIPIPDKDYYIQYFNTSSQIQSVLYDSAIIFDSSNTDITKDIFIENNKRYSIKNKN